ncbi:MAG: hypothetical protein AMXMBFR84_34660 [Candidatus Hydrogenedentota bacterium]
MAKLNQAHIDQITQRIERIPADAAPLWGKMNRDQMFGHLADVVRYSMGQGPEVPFKGNFKTKYVFAPLVLFGIKQIPQNIRAPRAKGAPEHGTRTCSAEELKSVLGEFLVNSTNGGMSTPHHPFFGHIGVSGWRRFHVVHCDHHLRQFGV